MPFSLTTQTLLASRVRDGALTTWLDSSDGRSLGFVTNGKRAMVLLLAADEDPGEHAVDLTATCASDGYVFESGQTERYSDRDTVPLLDAIRITSHIVARGQPPSDSR